jgi:hypothetical protein
VIMMMIFLYFEKINEFVKSINEKDEVLECQEDLLVKEKCKKMTNELNSCNDSISYINSKNVNLITKIEELNACYVSTSTDEHVTICTICRDIDVDAISDHLTLIKDQNDHIAKLNAKIAEHEFENEKF